MTDKSSTLTSSLMPCYFGEAVQWECDELGHLNMRHYMTKTHQARQYFFIHLGLEHAFRAGADSTVRTANFTIRYLKECRPGQRVKISTGLLSLDEDTAELLHIMTHFDGTVAAVITEVVAHIYLRTGERFRWPTRVRDAAAAHMTDRPAIAKPRGLPVLAAGEKPLAPALQALKDGGATLIGAGVFQPAETNIFGAVTPQSFLGRITESVGNFQTLWPEIHETFEAGGSISAALLEMSVHIHDTPTSGEPCVLYSAIQSANGYTRQAAHHIIDPISGQSWASVSASACLFDMATRRLVKTAPKRVEALNAAALPDLRA